MQTNLGSGIQSTGDAAGVQQLGPVKYKMKIAAMPVPKFSGKVVDYPEWRRLFKDCIESQYEESAAVMTLRTQALPDSLVHMVPRCADLSSVWEKLDKKFLDPSMLVLEIVTSIFPVHTSLLPRFFASRGDFFTALSLQAASLCFGQS